MLHVLGQALRTFRIFQRLHRLFLPKLRVTIGVRFHRRRLNLISGHVVCTFRMVGTAINRVLTFTARLTGVIRRIRLATVRTSGLRTTIPHSLSIAAHILHVQDRRLTNIQRLSRILSMVPAIRRNVMSANGTDVLPARPLMLPRRLVVKFNRNLTLQVAGTVRLIKPTHRTSNIGPFNDLTRAFNRHNRLLSIVPVTRQTGPWQTFRTRAPLQGDRRHTDRQDVIQVRRSGMLHLRTIKLDRYHRFKDLLRSTMSTHNKGLVGLAATRLTRVPFE